MIAARHKITIDSGDVTTSWLKLRILGERTKMVWKKKTHKKILIHSTYSQYYIDRIFHRSSELQHRCMTDHMEGQDDHKECSCIHG